MAVYRYACPRGDIVVFILFFGIPWHLVSPFVSSVLPSPLASQVSALEGIHPIALCVIFFSRHKALKPIGSVPDLFQLPAIIYATAFHEEILQVR